MSQDSAIAFLEKIDTDANLQKKLDALGEQASLDDIAKLAQAEGFDCSIADLQSYTVELTDEMLASVAGGASGLSAGDALKSKPLIGSGLGYKARFGGGSLGFYKV